MTTAERQVKAATVGAKVWGRRWGRDWRELLYGAWRGVSRPSCDLSRCPTTAAKWGIVNQLVSDEGKGGSRYRDEAAGDMFGAADDRPADWLARLVEAWGEYRPLRAGLPMRVRVRLYLWLVERWSILEVAAAWGERPQSVYREVAAAKVALGAAAEAKALARRGNPHT